MEIKTSELIHKELMQRATTYSTIKWVKVEDIKEMLRNFKERAKYKAKFCEDDFEQWIKELK